MLMNFSFVGMGMEDLIPTFSYLTTQVKELYPDFAYIHVVEAHVDGFTDLSPEDIKEFELMTSLERFGHLSR